MATVLWLPMLYNYFMVLQQRDSYKLWPLLAVVIAVIFVMRWRHAAIAATYAPRWALWGSAIMAMMLMLFALLYYVPYIAAMAWLAIMATGALYMSSRRRVENLFGIWCLLILFLRPPYQMTLRIMTWMENMSAETVSRILDYQGTLHVVQGNVMAMPSHDFRIDDICSGWISLVSMLACAAVLCVARNRRLFHTVMVLLMTVLSTWLLNIIRIIMVLRVKIHYGLDLLEEGYINIYHMLSFLIGMVLVLCTDSLVVFIYSRVKRDVIDADIIRRSRSLPSRIWKKVSGIELGYFLGYFRSTRPLRMATISFVFVLFGLFATIVLEGVVEYYRRAVIGMQFMYGDDDLIKLDEGAFILDRPGWEIVSYDTAKREYENNWGARSSTWRLKYNGLTVTVSLDYPFDDWHDVKRCYYNVGWQLAGEKIVRKLPVFKWPVSETDMILPNGDAGFILCSNSDHQGVPVMPKPAVHDHTMIIYRLHPSKMTPPFGTQYNKDKRTLYQTQCMVATPRPLDEATKEQIRLMYVDFREQIRSAIAEQS
ncbi:MAG: exosortase U [Akkermansiaceae bacterium]